MITPWWLKTLPIYPMESRKFYINITVIRFHSSRINLVFFVVIIEYFLLITHILLWTLQFVYTTACYYFELSLFILKQIPMNWFSIIPKLFSFFGKTLFKNFPLYENQLLKASMCFNEFFVNELIIIKSKFVKLCLTKKKHFYLKLHKSNRVNIFESWEKNSKAYKILIQIESLSTTYSAVFKKAIVL